MMLLAPPLWMVIATIAFHTRGGRIPNRLVFPAFALAFVTAAIFPPNPALHLSGSPLSVLAAAAIAFAISLLVFVLGASGAGAVKAHTTFAAWVGVVLPLDRAAAVSLSVTILAWICATLAGMFDARLHPDDHGRVFPLQTWLCALDVAAFTALMYATGAR